MDAGLTPTGIVLEGGSLPFALMGPAGGHRRVLVRSRGATLDLIGLDGWPDEDPKLHVRLFDLNLFQLGFGEPTPRNIVRSNVPVTIGGDDPRSSFYSFVWRGHATSNDRAMVRDLLQSITTDLELALTENRIDDLEITLSPLILFCQKISEKRARMRTNFRTMLAFAVLIYAVMAVWLLIARV